MFGKSKAVLCALATGAAIVVSATPAIADVQHFRFDGCETEDDNVQMCGSHHFFINRTETPSGNTMYVTHHRYDLTFEFTNGDSFSATGQSQYHELIQKGEPQEFHVRHREVYNSPATGTCYVDVFYHYANGDFQFDKTELIGNCP